MTMEMTTMGFDYAAEFGDLHQREELEREAPTTAWRVRGMVDEKSVRISLVNAPEVATSDGTWHQPFWLRASFDVWDDCWRMSEIELGGFRDRNEVVSWPGEWSGAPSWTVLVAKSFEARG